MSTWAERVHRRAADFSSVVTSCGHPSTSAPAYTYHLEKVKFGVSLDEVCKNDNIPGPLLVLILKLNKESPNRRDVFRAPGHQGAMKKLIHFLQSGRLVNVDNYSVYTIASVLKKFLRKIPNGIFGRDGEKELFTINELESEAEQIERLHKLFTSLPKYTQHLLVLLFGTFRVIASNAVHAATGMTSEALGVSVAPSFFQSCVSDGKTARMEDVLKFKVATKIMKNIIDKFATHDLFGRDNYEYYARVTGRILKVQDEWICSFQYPPPPRGKLAQQKYALQHSLEAEKTWLQCQCERWGLLAQEESRSTPALLTSSSSALDNSVVSLGVTPEHSFMESCARLSVSLEGPGLFAMTSSPLPKRHSSSNNHDLHHDDKDDDDEDDNIEDEDDYEHDDDDYEQDDENEYDDNDNNSEHEQRKRNYFATTAVLDGITMHKYDNQNESMDNFSKNINYAATATTTTTATTSPTASTAQSRVTRRLKTKSSKTTNAANDSLTDDIEEAGNSSGGGGGGIVVKRRYKQNKKKANTTNAANSSNNSSAAQIRSQQQQQQQHLRRLRSSSGNTKSLDISSLTTNSSQNCDFLLLNMMNSGDYENIQPGPLYHAASNSTLKGSDFSKQYPLQKARVCSRCKRGIRHSSSCSSSTASGGGGGGVGGAGVNGAGNGTTTNGNGMTLEELRAVNRYAESTKSLSYLPQVHERQTARMRTRSEWFLGPKDAADLLCTAKNTCSNCYLSAAAAAAAASNYLGGGSTRDMRHFAAANSDDNDNDDGDNNDNDVVDASSKRQHVEAINTTLYLFYKQRQQQQQQHQQQQHLQTQQQHDLMLLHQRQSFHVASLEQMDTDESYASAVNYGIGGVHHQQHLHLQQPSIHSMQQQQQQQTHLATTRVAPGTSAVAGASSLFTDNNYGRYDFDDKDILLNLKKLSHNKENNNCNSNNNNSNNLNNLNNNNHSNSINNINKITNHTDHNYSLSNRQHLIKTSSISKDIFMQQPQSLTGIAAATSLALLSTLPITTTATITSTSSAFSSSCRSKSSCSNKKSYCKHAKNNHNLSNYHSAEFLLNEPNIPNHHDHHHHHHWHQHEHMHHNHYCAFGSRSSKLHDDNDDTISKEFESNDYADQQRSSASTKLTYQNHQYYLTNANTTTTSFSSNSLAPNDNDDDDDVDNKSHHSNSISNFSSFEQARLSDKQHNDDDDDDEHEILDHILNKQQQHHHHHHHHHVDHHVDHHYNRHSTPMLQKRRRLRLQALRRQRAPSNTSSLYQSFNASLQAPLNSTASGNRRYASGHNHHMYANSNNVVSSSSSSATVIGNHASGGGGGGGGGAGSGSSSSGGNSNFVSIIFNVLDFLF